MKLLWIIAISATLWVAGYKIDTRGEHHHPTPTIRTVTLGTVPTIIGMIPPASFTTTYRRLHTIGGPFPTLRCTNHHHRVNGRCK